MTHQTISRTLAIGFLLTLSHLGVPSAAGVTSEKPNIVLIYIDDLGYGDLGAYDCTDIPTPHIDRLAAEGVRCTASYITNPPCCPSRCSLMMGQYGQRFGKYGMSRGLPIPENRPTLARFLQDHGYVTGQIGKWDIGTRRQGPLKVGFTEVAKVPPKKQYTKTELAGAPAVLRKQLANKNGHSKYFCIDKHGETVWLTDYDGDSMLNFINRHRAEPFFLYWSPEAIHSFNTEVPKRLSDRTRAQGKRRKLAGAIVSVDDQVGRLLDALNKHGLRKNTLIIFSSDNGANGGEGGSSSPYTGGKGQGTQKEGWVRVPTIFSMPSVLPQGRQYDGLIANFDFYATMAALAGQTIPEHCDGVDLMPYLTGKRTGDAHPYLFWLNNQPDDAVRRHLIAARWQDWRLYKKYEKDRWQLFDLRADPREERDIASQHPDVVTQMATQYTAWSKTLATLGEIPQIRTGEPIIPGGHGWAFASTKQKGHSGNPYGLSVEKTQWMKEATLKQLKGCRVKGAGGTWIHTPDGVGNYKALWTRDSYYMVEYAGDLMDPTEIKASIYYLLNGQRKDGCIPDRVNAAGQPVYSPGAPGKPLADNALDNGPFMAMLVCSYVNQYQDDLLFRDVELQLRKGLDHTTVKESGLVYNDPQDPQCVYGFTDIVKKTGNLLFSSLLFYKANLEMYELCKKYECGNPAIYKRRYERVRRSINTLWNEDHGMYWAADIDCKQIDIWGSAYAVEVGITSDKQAERIATYLVEHHDDLLMKGQIRHLTRSEGGWDNLFKSCREGTYQNGAYWATPLAWVIPVYAKHDPSLAKDMLETVVADFQKNGINECINNGYVKVPNFVVSATNVYALTR